MTWHIFSSSVSEVSRKCLGVRRCHAPGHSCSGTAHGHFFRSAARKGAGRVGPAATGEERLPSNLSQHSPAHRSELYNSTRGVAIGLRAGTRPSRACVCRTKSSGPPRRRDPSPRRTPRRCSGRGRARTSSRARTLAPDASVCRSASGAPRRGRSTRRRTRQCCSSPYEQQRLSPQAACEWRAGSVLTRRRRPGPIGPVRLARGRRAVWGAPPPRRPVWRSEW